MGRSERKMRRARAEGIEFVLLLLLELLIWFAGPIIGLLVVGGIGLATFGTIGMVIGGVIGLFLGLIIECVSMFDVFDLF